MLTAAMTGENMNIVLSIHLAVFVVTFICLLLSRRIRNIICCENKIEISNLFIFSAAWEFCITAQLLRLADRKLDCYLDAMTGRKGER